MCPQRKRKSVSPEMLHSLVSYPPLEINIKVPLNQDSSVKQVVEGTYLDI